MINVVAYTVFFNAFKLKVGLMHFIRFSYMYVFWYTFCIFLTVWFGLLNEFSMKCKIQMRLYAIFFFRHFSYLITKFGALMFAVLVHLIEYFFFHLIFSLYFNSIYVCVCVCAHSIQLETVFDWIVHIDR